MAYKGSMKYFVLTSKGKYPFPQIINWSQASDMRKLTRNEYRELPAFFLLNAKLGMDGIFPDVIEKPVLLFSRTAMEVTALYDSDIPFLFAALFDTEKGECASYYCPVLEEEDCLAGKPGPGQRGIILDRSKMNGLPLFRVRIGLESATIIRMDLAESLLEREASGLKLKEVSVSGSSILK
ncbi:hypothetical protein [Lacrimispora sp.]|uniref:hypothetical protein n=1 Tax=Lacrimispora sp. TaxID=2719234 RepID=UPI00285D1BC4|nr:hypothetical protein [Lacrimispora sp.]MDR7810477.1 hypothetical protein [Lacrimispora sp.]